MNAARTLSSTPLPLAARAPLRRRCSMEALHRLSDSAHPADPGVSASGGGGGVGRALRGAARADLVWLPAVPALPPSPSCGPRCLRVVCVCGGGGTCLSRGGAPGLGLAPARAGTAGIPILRTPASARVVVVVGWVVP